MTSRHVSHLTLPAPLTFTSPTKSTTHPESLAYCWINVGPPSATLAQHQTSIGSMARAGWHMALASSLVPRLAKRTRTK